MSSLDSELNPTERAAFAVSSRLLSCLVTESLLRAFYLPVHKSSRTCGIVVVLSTNVLAEHPNMTRALRANDIFAIIPLRNPPVLKHEAQKHGTPVGLLDPLDMLPEVYDLINDKSDNSEHVRYLGLIRPSILSRLLGRT
jgi:hypothetical protein